MNTQVVIAVGYHQSCRMSDESHYINEGSTP
jgi:hypothetical protein